MPGFPAPFIKFREDDENGNPLAGGKLWSYAAGTSTPLPTYNNQDLAPGHENTNPTILDAAGRANIWMEDGVGYKFVLMDALDNIIWTQDNVQIPEIEAPPASNGVPAGTIAMFGGTVAPTGWLMCDGAAHSRTTEADLFDVIGETFGAGNGSTTFNVPNLQQRFPLGKATSGTGSTLGATGGTIDHVHPGPGHTHTINSHVHTLAHTHTVARDAFGPAVAGAPSTFPNMVILADPAGLGGTFGPTVDATTSAASVSDTGGVALTTNSSGTADTGTANPPFLVVNFIIKT